ncbi:MAG TPA: SPW repeat protein [Pedobacter sp.]|nr:SPW repeat protein [Pedobacter sp.]
MKIIRRKFHVVLDYLSAVVLIAAPWLLGFSGSVTATAVAIIAGILILAMSFMTDYEGGILRSIPMSMHLNMDILLGLALTLSPWVLAFKHEVYLPHVIMGLLAIFSGLFTVRTSAGRPLR